MKKLFIILFIALLFPSVSFASGLTDIQINCIITLLQSFGVDSLTLNNVSKALHSEPVIAQSVPIVPVVSPTIAPEQPVQELSATCSISKNAFDYPVLNISATGGTGSYKYCYNCRFSSLSDRFGNLIKFWGLPEEDKQTRFVSDNQYDGVNIKTDFSKIVLVKSGEDIIQVKCDSVIK